MFLTTVLFLLGGSVPSGYEVTQVQHGLAAVYWPGDGNSGPTCADGKPFTKTRCHVAHRSWPLGSKVRVCSKTTKRCTISFIGDRGPYGACDAAGMKKDYTCRGRWIAQVYSRGKWRIRYPGQRWRTVSKKVGRWRGIVDLSRCVWKRIGGSGLQPVRLELLRKKRKRRQKHVAQAHNPSRPRQTNSSVSQDTSMSAMQAVMYEDPGRLWAWYAPGVAVVHRRSTWRRRRRTGFCFRRPRGSFARPVSAEETHH